MKNTDEDFEKIDNCDENKLWAAKSRKSEKAWRTTKLIIGIVSIIFFILVFIDAYLTGVFHFLPSALLVMLGGGVAITTRKSKNNFGNIVTAILYFFASILLIYTHVHKMLWDGLPIEGTIVFIFGLIFLSSVFFKINAIRTIIVSTFVGVLIIILYVTVYPLLLSMNFTTVNNKVIEEAKKGEFKSTAIGIIVKTREACLSNSENTSDRSLEIIIENSSVMKGRLDHVLNENKPISGKILVNNFCEVRIAIENGVWCARKEINDEEIALTSLANDRCLLE